jgi:hypothetical protein
MLHQVKFFPFRGISIMPTLLMIELEVLDALIQKADDWAIFSRLGVQSIKHRTSLYADDFIMFLSPTPSNLHLTKEILQAFEQASGSGCNLSKCQLAPIHCDANQVQLAISIFPCQVVEFTITNVEIHDVLFSS